MKNIITTTAAVVACTFTLISCGGGDSGNGSAVSRADEGIWSNFSNGTVTNLMPNMMQVLILSDGSYWGIAGQNFSSSETTPELGSFCVNGGILHGTASISGSSVSGSYTNFTGFPPANGTYVGTVSAQKTLNLTFNAPANPLMSGASGNFNLSYDDIYNQRASLSAIAGNYLDQNGKGCPSSSAIVLSNSQPNDYIHPKLIISGSNLTLTDQDGNMIMMGTIAPHGTTVNVFDISLTTATTVMRHSMAGLFSGNNDVPVKTNYTGILFRTASGNLKNYIEIVAASGNDSAYFYMGSKQD